jgi:hypothetical protein
VSHKKTLGPNLKDYEVKNGKVYPREMHPALKRLLS